MPHSQNKSYREQSFSPFRPRTPLGSGFFLLPFLAFDGSRERGSGNLRDTRAHNPEMPLSVTYSLPHPALNRSPPQRRRQKRYSPPPAPDPSGDSPSPALVAAAKCFSPRASATGRYLYRRSPFSAAARTRSINTPAASDADRHQGNTPSARPHAARALLHRTPRLLPSEKVPHIRLTFAAPHARVSLVRRPFFLVAAPEKVRAAG